MIRSSFFRAFPIPHSHSFENPVNEILHRRFPLSCQPLRPTSNFLGHVIALLLLLSLLMSSLTHCFLPLKDAFRSNSLICSPNLAAAPATYSALLHAQSTEKYCLLGPRCVTYHPGVQLISRLAVASKKSFFLRQLQQCISADLCLINTSPTPCSSPHVAQLSS